MKLNLNPSWWYPPSWAWIINRIWSPFTSIFSAIIDFINFSYHFFILTTFFLLHSFPFFLARLHLLRLQPPEKQQCPSQRSERRSFYTSSTFSLVSLFFHSSIITIKRKNRMKNRLSLVSFPLNKKVISYLMLKGFNLLFLSLFLSKTTRYK